MEDNLIKWANGRGTQYLEDNGSYFDFITGRFWYTMFEIVHAQFIAFIFKFHQLSKSMGQAENTVTNENENGLQLLGFYV